MKRKSLLFALLLALLMPWAANAQQSIPYTEGFENMSSADDLTAAGWISYQTHSGSFLAIETSASNVHSGSQALNIDSWDAGSSSDYVVVGLPLVDAAINGLQITFSYKVSTGNVYVGYLTDADDASTFVSLESYVASSNYTTVTKELNEAPATAARIAIKYLNWYRCYVDDIEVKALPTCIKPTLGAAQFISEEGASFQWTENGSAISWVLEYSADQNFTNATSVNRSGIPNYAITGLNAGTLYYVHVKSDCGGGDESDWSNVVTFTTLCEPINAEGYSENFDSYTGTSSGSTINLPDCWNRINTCSYSYYSGYPNIYNSNYSSSPNCLRFYSYYSSFSNYDPQPQYAILPPMNGLAGMQVTLKAKGSNNTSTFKIGTMSDPSDASTFTMIAEQTGLTTSYQEFEYIIPANCRDNYLAIMIEAATTSTANGVCIDDIVIATAPTCIKPSGLEVTATTATTATLSWTNGAEGQTAWQICLNGDETNLIDADSNPFTIDEEGVLSPASTYTAKVRANCGNGDFSDWSNTVTIETLCDVITITDSWSENFNSLTSGIPNCWDNSEGTTTIASYKWNYYATGHDGACLRFNSYSNSSGNTNFLKTPTLNFATGKVMRLSFWYKNPTGDDFSVFISTDGGDTYTTALVTGLTGASRWTQQEINLSDYVDAENVVIVFKGTSNYGSGDAYIYLDDVAIAEAPSCLKPTELAVTANSITYDGAVITWTAGASETQWQIEFATDADFTNPLYETVNADPDDEAYVPTYTFHGLTESTTYYVHVQAVCGGSNGSSEYSSVVSFTTLQTPVNLPYSTDFESGNDWLFVNGGLTNAWAYGTATSNGEGTHALYISNDGGTTNAYSISSNAAMVYATKLFNFEAGTYVFSYDWKAYGESTYDYLRVALVPSSEQLTAGTSAPSVPSGTFYNNLPTGWIALDGGEKLNLKSDWQSFASDEMEIAAGTYMMVFAWRNDGGGGITPPAAIDNVSIEVITCTTPTNLDVPESGITATSAQLSWTETGEATAWEIELTDTNDNTLTIPVTETDLVEGVYTIASLNPETVYTAKVRANCGDGYSHWSEETIFETASECPIPDGLAAENITINSAVISWNGYGQETFRLRYSTTEVTWENQLVVTNPYLLESLVPATTYYMQVQPTCANEETWSATYSFTTKCDAITITEDDTYSESFEGYTGVAYNVAGVVPTCWDSYSTGSVAPHIISSGTGNYVYLHEGSNALTFYGSGYCYAAMPEFTNALSELEIKFWMQTESASNGSLVLGYITAEDENYNTFTAIETYANNNNSMVQRTTDLNEVPATATRLVFRWYLSSQWSCCIDDVEVTLIPTCMPPSALEVTGTTLTTATLSWTAGGSETAWQICLNGDETNPIIADSNPFTVEGLTSSTAYTAKVRANCSADDQSDWSNEVSFTTECDVIVVDAAHPFAEDFSTWAPLCWELGDDGNNHNWTQSSGVAYSGYYGTIDLYMPTLNISAITGATPVLSFQSKEGATGYYTGGTSGNHDGLNIVKISTDNGSTWTQLWCPTIDELTTRFRTVTLGLENYVDSDILIAFEYQGTDAHSWYIDDVEIVYSFTLDIIGYGDSDGGYYLIASPVESVTPTADNGFITADYDLYYFNEAATENEWVNFKGENGNFNLVSGKGYLYASKTDTQLQFTGVPYSGNGEVTLHKTDGANFEGWNLVGNPFNETAYLPANRAFYTMQNDGTVIAEVNPQQRSIEAMEAVFVVAENDGDTLTFSTTAPAKSAMVALNLNNRNSLIDRAIIRFDEGSTLPKLQLRRNSTKLYIPQDGNDYAVVRGESMGAMPVNFKAESNGRYTITLSSEEVSFSYLHLIDKVAKTDVDLLANPSYSFDAQTTDLANRFELVFATGSSTSSDTFAFYSNGNWVINNEGDATLQVIDINGRILNSESINGCANVNVNTAAGVYMLRLVNGDNVKVQKVVVR